MRPGFFALMVMCSLNAFAGLSSQDPNVAKLRGDYSAATPTRMSDIQVNGEYECYMFQAWEGAYDVIPYKLSFKSLDGILLMKMDWGSRFTADILPIKDGQGGITAKSKGSRNDLSFRSASGLLLIEQSTKEQVAAKEEKSVSVPKATTQNFTACQAPITPSANSIP